jgi:hypothetical protein
MRIVNRTSSPVIGVSRSVSKTVGHLPYFRPWYLVTVVLTVAGAMRVTGGFAPHPVLGIFVAPLQTGFASALPRGYEPQANLGASRPSPTCGHAIDT